MEKSEKGINSLVGFFTDIEGLTNYGNNKVGRLIIDEDMSIDDLFRKIAKLDDIKDAAVKKMLDSPKYLIDWINKQDEFDLYFGQLRSFMYFVQAEVSTQEYAEYQAKFNKLLEKIYDYELDTEAIIFKYKKRILELLNEPALAVYRRWFNMKYWRNEKHLPDEKGKVLLDAIGGTQILNTILSTVLNDDFKEHGTIVDSNGDVVVDEKGNKLREITKEDWDDPEFLKSLYKRHNSGITSHFNTIKAIMIGMFQRSAQEMAIRKFKNKFEYLMHDYEINTSLGTSILQQSALFKDVFLNYRQQVDRMTAAQIGYRVAEPWFRHRGLYFPTIKITRKEAVKDSLAALSVLGDEYVDCFQKIIDENWIDWDDPAPSSDYSMTGRGNGRYPIRIKFEENTEGVMTLIHEAGHSVNAMMSKGLGIYSGIQSLIAEIPSFTNEALLFCYYMDQKYRDNDNYEHFTLIYNYMKRLYNNLCENPTLSIASVVIEKLIYEKKPSEISFGDFVHLYREVAKTYGGITEDEERWMECKDDEDERNIYDWNKFINVISAYETTGSLKYFFGALIGTSIGIDLYYDRNDMRKKYLKFLHKGNTSSPLEALKELGFDVSKKSTYSRLVRWLEQMLEEFSQYNSGSKSQSRRRQEDDEEESSSTRTRRRLVRSED